MDLSEKGALDALYATGHWLLTEQRWLDAARVFHAMLICAPSDERGWLALGACHEGREDFETAHGIYVGGGRATNGESARCEIARARAAKRIGLDEDAERAYERAVTIADNRDESELRKIAEQERCVA